MRRLRAWDISDRPVRRPVLAILVTAGALAAVLAWLTEDSQTQGRAAVEAPAELPVSTPQGESPETMLGEPIRWHRSVALGVPQAGRLVRGVQLPSEGESFFTWDPVRRTKPNRPWRRYGTDRLVRVLLRVLAEFRAAHPTAPRIGIGDLSRPHGGDFGRRFGSPGHASHQNGLDADLYYPRGDAREREPSSVNQVNRALAQDLVDRFVRNGARFVFVGPHVGLRGPVNIVQPLPGHDDHLHVRLWPR